MGGHSLCFIARSVKFSVDIAPEITERWLRGHARRWQSVLAVEEQAPARRRTSRRAPLRSAKGMLDAQAQNQNSRHPIDQRDESETRRKRMRSIV